MVNKSNNVYTDEELLEYLKKFNKEHDRPPVISDMYIWNLPRPNTYIRRFGSWNKALKLVGLDTDSIVKKGIVKTENQKARLFELMVKEHFKQESIDLSGENWKSICDGICPNGQIYDAKSSALQNINGSLYWHFHIDIYRFIEWYYLGAFDENFNKLVHVWRIHSTDDIMSKSDVFINVNRVDNMWQYEITEKFKL